MHGLRHTSATMLISEGVNIKSVSSRLGHSNTNTTLDVYSHALIEVDRTATDNIEEFLFGKIENIEEPIENQPKRYTSKIKISSLISYMISKNKAAANF